MVLALAMAGTSTASAQARNFSIDRARVTFTSRAQLETINGLGNQGSGSFRVDPSNLSSVSGTVTIPVRSLRTGIEERDEHMVGPDWLNAGAHPNATFEITGVSGARTMPANEDVEIQVRGRFTINGQTHDVNARVRAKWDGADGLRLRAQFSIELDDYGVSIPSVVRAKVSNEIRIQVQIRASA